MGAGALHTAWPQLPTKHHQTAPHEGRWKNVKMVKIQQKCEWEGAAIQSRTWNRVVVFLRQEAFVRQRPGLHSTGGPPEQTQPWQEGPGNQAFKTKRKSSEAPKPLPAPPQPLGCPLVPVCRSLFTHSFLRLAPSDKRQTLRTSETTSWNSFYEISLVKYTHSSWTFGGPAAELPTSGPESKFVCMERFWGCRIMG